MSCENCARQAERVRDYTHQLRILKDALEWYADQERWLPFPNDVPRHSEANVDHGYRAIMALAESRQAEFVSPEQVQPVTNSLQTTAHERCEDCYQHHDCCGQSCGKHTSNDPREPL